jgi:sugar lactone lactonase YvrE
MSRLTELATGAFFESPRWHDGRWYVSDFGRRVVVAVTETGEEETILAVPRQPGGLGWRADGTMLVVSRKDHKLLQCPPGGDVEVLAELGHLCGGSLNDMVVDEAGRAWVGDTGFDVADRDAPVRPTTLKRVDPDGTVAVVADGLICPNGAVITPDGATLIVGESFACRYTAFTIGADGSLTDRRVWAELAALPPLETFGKALAETGVAPDGCGLDAEGQIWSADGVGGRCIRIAEGGAITDEIRVPDGMHAYACMLGGADGRTLVVCVNPDFSGADGPAAKAQLLTARVDVPRAGCP